MGSWKKEPCKRCNKFYTYPKLDDKGKEIDRLGACKLESKLFGKPEYCWDHDTEAGVDG